MASEPNAIVKQEMASSKNGLETLLEWAENLPDAPAATPSSVGSPSNPAAIPHNRSYGAKSMYKDYFDFKIDKNGKFGVCKLCLKKNVTINIKMQRSNTSGIKRHLERMHKAIYHQLFKKRSMMGKTLSGESFRKTEKNQDNMTDPIQTYESYTDADFNTILLVEEHDGEQGERHSSDAEEVQKPHSSKSRSKGLNTKAFSPKFEEISKKKMQLENNNNGDKRETRKEDACEITGRKIAFDLRQMSETQRMIADKIINDVCFFGKAGLLQMSHSFSV